MEGCGGWIERGTVAAGSQNGASAYETVPWSEGQRRRSLRCRCLRVRDPPQSTLWSPLHPRGSRRTH